jgi:hypothetical protein
MQLTGDAAVFLLLGADEAVPQLGARFLGAPAAGNLSRP